MYDINDLLLVFADVDRQAFYRAPRNERNYILFICIAILVAIILTWISVFYFVSTLFLNWLLGIGISSGAGLMVYFFHRTLLRDNNRRKLFVMLMVAFLDGALLAVPLKVSLTKPYLEKQILAETKQNNDALYDEIVLQAQGDIMNKIEKARQELKEAAKRYDQRGGKGVQELADARRNLEFIESTEAPSISQAENRFESMKKDPDTSFMGLLSYYFTSLSKEQGSAVAIFSNLAFLFFFFIFESAPILIRLMFNEENSLYLQEIEHKTKMAFKGSSKVHSIDNNIMDMNDMNQVRLAIMEKKIWNELTLLMSQDDPDPQKLEELQQTIAYLEEQKANPGPSSTITPEQEDSDQEDEDDDLPEFEYQI